MYPCGKSLTALNADTVGPKSVSKIGSKLANFDAKKQAKNQGWFPMLIVVKAKLWTFLQRQIRFCRNDKRS